MSSEGVDLDSDFSLVAPLARSEGLVLTELDGELVIYDAEAKHIHRLCPLTAAVWRRCDGRATIPRIATDITKELGTPVDVEAVGLALTKLADVALVSGRVPVAPVSRRGFTRRKAMLGAAAIPAIVSISAPQASAAATGDSPGSVGGGDCTLVSGKRLDDCNNTRSDHYCCWYDRNKPGVCLNGSCLQL